MFSRSPPNRSRSLIESTLIHIWDKVVPRQCQVHRHRRNRHRRQRNVKCCRRFFIVLCVFMFITIISNLHSWYNQPQHINHRIHIIQSDNRDLSPDATDYQTLTAVINFMYAQHHGYQYTRYQFDNEEIPNQLDPTLDPKNQTVCGGRAAPWCKLISIYHTLTRIQENDWVLFMDSDSAFMKYDISIEEYLSTTKWNRTVDNPSLIMSSGYPYVMTCTGIWMVRNDKVGRTVLKEWWNCQLQETGQCQQYFEKHSFEQPVFNFHLFPRWHAYISVLMDYSIVEGQQTFWDHIGSDRVQQRVPHFTDLLRAMQKKWNAVESIDTNFIIETISRYHTVRLQDHSQSQIQLEKDK